MGTPRRLHQPDEDSCASIIDLRRNRLRPGPQGRGRASSFSGIRGQAPDYFSGSIGAGYLLSSWISGAAGEDAAASCFNNTFGSTTLA